MEIPVVLMGRVAAEAFQSEQAWEVCAVFTRSFYCKSSEGSLVCVGPRGLGAGPLNALCLMPEAMRWDTGHLKPGAPAVCDGSILCVAGSFAFTLTEAAVWRPTCPVPPWSKAMLAEGLARLADAVRAWPPRGGLHGLVPGLIWPSRRELIPDTPLVRMALPGIARLGRWLEESLADPLRGSPAPLPEAEILIGLGPGLTPSGDDFVGGVLVALHAFGCSALAERLGAEVLSRAGRRTNIISVAHLACAAGGEGSAALHDVLVALLVPGAPDLPRCLRSIDAIGHTSGWDALAGATLTLAAVAQSHRTEPRSDPGREIHGAG